MNDAAALMERNADTESVTPNEPHKDESDRVSEFEQYKSVMATNYLYSQSNTTRNKRQLFIGKGKGR